MKESLRILLLDNNRADAEIVKHLLTKSGCNYEFHFADNRETYLEALEQFRPDIILSDTDLDEIDANEALQIIKQRSLCIPFILVTGSVSEEFAVNIMKSGAVDYILKDRLARLPHAVDTAIKQRQIEREKHIAIEDLKQREEQYRRIFSNSPMPKWIYDFETLRFLEVNEMAVKHYGYTTEEFLSMTIKDIRPKNDHAQLAADLLKIEWEPDIRRGSWRHLKKNGQEIIVKTTAHFIPYKGRKARIVVVDDITERVKTEQEKEFTSKNLSALINNTNDLMWSVDKDLTLITCNDSFNRITETILGKPILPGEYMLPELFGEDVVARYKEFYNRAFSGEAFSFVERLEKPVQLWSEISFYPIRQGNTVIGTACFSRDISHAKKAEEELRSMQKQLLYQKVQAQKKVTRAIIKGQEKERNHIGRELHDNVNQLLVSAKLYIDIACNENAAIKPLVRYPVELISNCIAEIRSLTSGYVAPLKNIDLRELIQSLLDKVRAGSGIQTDFIYQATDQCIEDELKLNLYRIIQEQINNIVKHADAKNLVVALRIGSNLLELQVSDDGKGFDTGQKRKGIGVANMINRVELFNGEIKIESTPRKGCEVYIKIPVEAK